MLKISLLLVKSVDSYSPEEAAKRCIASPSPDLDHIADESLGHAKLLLAQCAPILNHFDGRSHLC